MRRILKADADLSYAEMNNRAQKLLDSRVFLAVSFKFDGQDLRHGSTDARMGMLPIRLQNLPIVGGKDLDEKLHRQFPLSRIGSGAGRLTESVRSALEMLAAQGIKATVAAMLFRNGSASKAEAVNFSITAPPVLVGEIGTEEGTIVMLDPKVSAILAKFPGAAYDAEGSIKQIETDLQTPITATRAIWSPRSMQAPP